MMISDRVKCAPFRNVLWRVAKQLSYYYLSVIRKLRFLISPNRLQKILVLFVYADRTKYSKAHDQLLQVLGEFPQENWRLIKINNFNSTDSCLVIDKNIFEIGGDNSAWEFSGWKKGLLSDYAKAYPSDIVLFVNDAFLNDEHRGFDLDYFRSIFNPVICGLLKGAAFGLISKTNGNCRVYDQPCNWFVRSHFFAIDREIANKVELVHLEYGTAHIFMPEDWRGFIFNRNAPISPDLKEFLEAWMTQLWPRTVELNEHNWPLIRSKLIAILNERLLSVELLKLNTVFLIPGRINFISGARDIAPYVISS